MRYCQQFEILARKDTLFIDQIDGFLMDIIKLINNKQQQGYDTILTIDGNKIHRTQRRY